MEITRIIKVHLKPLLIVLLIWGAYFIIVFFRSLFMGKDGLYGGHGYIWGDWSLHVGMAQIFATKPPSEWFSYHPYYAGGKFTYGFLANLISGLLMRSGYSTTSAFIIPSILCALLLVVGMYSLIYLATRSKPAAVVAMSIFFLSSGLGFTKFLTDFLMNPSISGLLYPQMEYSKISELDWGSGNFIVGMLVPQRAFLLGMTMAVWSLAFLLLGIRRSGKDSRQLLLMGGILAGLLPVAHMHSFIVIVTTCFFLLILLRKYWVKFAVFALPAGLLSVVLYFIYIHGGIENPHFSIWEPGYSSTKKGLLAWLVMWWRFWGVALPLSIFCLYSLRKKLSREIYALVLSASVLFILGNLIRLQPIRWDNSKIFLWVYFYLSPVMSLGIVRMWPRRYWGKVLAVLLMLLLTFTGCLELIRLARTDKNSSLMITYKDMRLGERIRSSTSYNAVFVTNPSHNHLIMMWGARPILMGFSGWVWNYGFLYQERERNIRQIYLADENLDVLLKKYKVSYIFIGPGEQHKFKPDLSRFYERFPVAFEDENNLIFDVRSASGAE